MKKLSLLLASLVTVFLADMEDGVLVIREKA